MNSCGQQKVAIGQQPIILQSSEVCYNQHAQPLTEIQVESNIAIHNAEWDIWCCDSCQPPQVLLCQNTK